MSLLQPNLNAHHTMNFWQIAAFFILSLQLSVPMGAMAAEANQGITDTSIRVGSIMPLTGNSAYDGTDDYSSNMKNGIEAALKDQVAQGRKIELEVMNDDNDPMSTIQDAKKLMNKGVFIMLGNVGALSTLKVVKVLEANQIPMLGFLTLGDINADNMLNYRPNPAQEVASLFEHAVKSGVKPSQVCLFVQNDVFGMSGLNGLKEGLKQYPDAQPEMDKINALLEMMWGGINPALNNVGPVGFYQSETVFVRDAYLSLKHWENESGNACKQVIVLAIPRVAADFIAYSRSKNEPWSFSAISATAAGNTLSGYLSALSVNDNIVVSQVVPPLNSNLPIVVEARKALGDGFNHISLEGYIVGRAFTTLLKSMKDPLTRANFVKAARQKPIDVGGLTIDFSRNGAGSSLVSLNNLKSGVYHALNDDDAHSLPNTGPTIASPTPAASSTAKP